MLQSTVRDALDDLVMGLLESGDFEDSRTKVIFDTMQPTDFKQSAA